MAEVPNQFIIQQIGLNKNGRDQISAGVFPMCLSDLFLEFPAGVFVTVWRWVLLWRIQHNIHTSNDNLCAT